MILASSLKFEVTVVAHWECFDIRGCTDLTVVLCIMFCLAVLG